MKHTWKTTLSLTAGLGVALVGCGSKRSSSSTSSTVTLSGTVATSSLNALSVGGEIYHSSAISDYKLYCITFETTPSAASTDFGSDGSFSVTLPADTPFGCFVNNKTTNLPVATFTTSVSGGFAGDTTSNSSLSLSSSADLGSLTLDLDTGKVSIPAEKLTGKTTTSTTSSLDLDQIHGQSYKMECITTGVTEVDNACAEFASESPTVFFRILKGTSGGADVRGLGVWASSSAFAACGSIDMTDSEKSGISDVTFTQNDTGSAYSNVGSTCDSRYGATAPYTHEELNNYYALEQLIPTAGGYTMRQEDTFSSGNCTGIYELSVFFSGAVDQMVGAFEIYEKQSAGCGQASESKKAFNVKFVKQ